MFKKCFISPHIRSVVLRPFGPKILHIHPSSWGHSLEVPKRFWCQNKLLSVFMVVLEKEDEEEENGTGNVFGVNLVRFVLFALAKGQKFMANC